MYNICFTASDPTICIRFQMENKKIAKLIDTYRDYLPCKYFKDTSPKEDYAYRTLLRMKHILTLLYFFLLCLRSSRVPIYSL